MASWELQLPGEVRQPLRPQMASRFTVGCSSSSALLPCSQRGAGRGDGDPEVSRAPPPPPPHTLVSLQGDMHTHFSLPRSPSDTDSRHPQGASSPRRLAPSWRRGDQGRRYPGRFRHLVLLAPSPEFKGERGPPTTPVAGCLGTCWSPVLWVLLPPDPGEGQWQLPPAPCPDAAGMARRPPQLSPAPRGVPFPPPWSPVVQPPPPSPGAVHQDLRYPGQTPPSPTPGALHR